MQLSKLLVVCNRTGTKQGERVSALCLAAPRSHTWENALLHHSGCMDQLFLPVII